MESIFLSSISRPVSCILIDEQHGFRSGRSITTCNAIFSGYVLDTFRIHSQVNVIYTDFAKAFDRVNHSALVMIIKSVGFGLWGAANIIVQIVSIQ